MTIVTSADISQVRSALEENADVETALTMIWR
jgi:hypothetical protein